MKIAAAQIACRPGNRDANVTNILSYVTKAALRHCDLIVFPELSDTGYDMNVIRANALAAGDPPVAMLCESARKNRMAIICGLSNRDEDGIYNTSVIIDKDGKIIATYRKTHLFKAGEFDECAHFTPGNELVTANIDGWKLGVMICYDLRFPELARTLALRDIHLLVVSAAWPFPRDSHWKTLLYARAIENQLFVVGANRVGKDGDFTFCGSSCILDARGVLLAAASANREELLETDIEQIILETVRGYMPVFKDRRTDLYRV